MSEPPSTAATTSLNPHHPRPASSTAAATSSSLSRDYRKGNWTIQETLILITAKKLNDERRIKVSSTPTDPSSSSASKHSRRTGELRWKWVENYCWTHGCLRSQNQCNDKWDNLLRDYKKVREYEYRSSVAAASGDDHLPSYWKLEKHERKDRNIPSNMSSEVFEALIEVVHRRHPQHSPALPSTPPISVHQPSPPPPPIAALAVSEKTDSPETECSDKLKCSTKRRKFRNIGRSIVSSASVLARTMESSEKRKDERHREVMELEERRIQIEETRNKVNRQGIIGLASAVNNLSGAIQTLISGRQRQS